MATSHSSSVSSTSLTNAWVVVSLISRPEWPPNETVALKLVKHRSPDDVTGPDGTGQLLAELLQPLVAA